MQKHHIIPLCKGGPHTNWNIVALTKKDHAWAHALRAQTFHEIEDIQTLKLFNLHTDIQDPSFYKKISETIASFEADNLIVKPSFGSSSSKVIQKKTTWSHPDLSSLLIVKAGTVKQTPDLKLLFIKHLPVNSETRSYLISLSNITFRNRLNNLVKSTDNSMYGFKLLSVE